VNTHVLTVWQIFPPQPFLLPTDFYLHQL
jgi:glutathionylspermidine synthase